MHGLIRPMFRPSIMIWLESRLITASPSLKLARRCDRRADASFVVTGDMRPPVSVAGVPRRSRRWSFRGGRASAPTFSRRRAAVQFANATVQLGVGLLVPLDLRAVDEHCHTEYRPERDDQCH